MSGTSTPSSSTKRLPRQSKSRSHAPCRATSTCRPPPSPPSSRRRPQRLLPSTNRCDPGTAVSVTPGTIDVAAIRADFPIEDVVRAAGVELRATGQGFTGCCPFHDDSTPSLSVGGVPDRFTCFGCGAHGDVIDFVQRLHGLTFVDAVRSLTTGRLIPALPADAAYQTDVRRLSQPSPPPKPGASRSMSSPGNTSQRPSRSRSPTAISSTTAESTSTLFDWSTRTTRWPATRATAGPLSSTSCDATE